MDWIAHVETVLPHVVRITTPEAAGTGFLVQRSEGRIGIGTAAHVVRDAVAWKQAIRIHHPAFENPLTWLDGARTAILHPQLDSAYVAGPLPESFASAALPAEAINHVPTSTTVKPGVEVGWMGYPSVAPSAKPSFFCGHVSQYDESNRRYFIDGVAIPGVSGGPAFLYHPGAGYERIYILGSITAYASDSSGGTSTPGLMVADECGHWQETLEGLNASKAAIPAPS